MSLIERLGITGLRSYDPERIETIDFLRPLTLIVGRNGCGKTTILEALRLAICGAMPPASASGRAFVADPRLAGRADTRAAVKLKFVALGGRAVLCVRSMHLATGKRDEFRKVEQFIKVRDEAGATVTVGHTCAELDRQVPELLGVPRAVIENVILCHQEEALWPFADSATLKRVFDELFDTARVAKLAEQLGAVLKDRRRALQDERAALELARKDLEVYAGLQLELRNVLEAHQRAAAEAEKAMARLAVEKGFVETESFERTIGASEEQLRRARSELIIVDGELLSTKHFADCVFVEETLFNADLPAPTDAERADRDFLSRLVALLFQENDLKSEKATPSLCSLPEWASRRRLSWQRYREHYTEMKEQLAMRLSAETVAMSQISESLRQSDLVFLLKDIRSMFMRLFGRQIDRDWTGDGAPRDELAAALVEARRSLRERGDNFALTELELRQREQRLSNEAERVAGQIRRRGELDSLEQYRLLEAALQASTTRLGSLQTKRSLLAELVEGLNARRTALGEECALSARHVTHRAFAELEQRRAALRGRLPEVGERGAIERALEERRAALGEDARRRDKAERAEVELEALRRHKERDRRALEEANAAALQKLDLGAFAGQSNAEYLFSEYKTGKERLRAAETQIALMTYVTSELLPHMLELSTRAGRCVLCEKALFAAEAPSVRATLGQRLGLAEGERAEALRELEASKARHLALKQCRAQLREVETRAERRRALGDELEQLCAALAALALERRLCAERIERAERELEALKELQSVEIALEEFERSSLESGFIWDQNRTAESLAALRAELRETESNIAGAERSLLEIAAESGSEEARAEKLRRELGGFRSPAAVDQSLELASFAELQAQLAELGRAGDAARAELAALCCAAEAERAAALARVQALESLEVRVDEYAAATRANSLVARKAESERAVLTLNAELQKCEQRIRFLALAERKESIEGTLSRLESDLRGLQRSHAETLGRRQLCETLRGELARAEGELGLLRAQSAALVERLAKTQDCERVFLEHQATAEYQRQCVDDITALLRAVEDALVDYHREKIEEINRLIEGIWRSAYAGDDIFSVQIRSEARDADGERARRQYEYKVVFVNADRREVGMKGRCSAGQKVLASIVIRLALSEAFCVNCGLLALDEPTTNLDEENIRLLGAFLRRLIKARTAHKTFQLVVITHDPHFVGLLSEHLNGYYIVSRDERGFSKITRTEDAPIL